MKLDVGHAPREGAGQHAGAVGKDMRCQHIVSDAFGDAAEAGHPVNSRAAGEDDGTIVPPMQLFRLEIRV